MHTWPPLIPGRHKNLIKGHIISEFTSLYKILCSPACDTINIKATLQGEIFSGENGLGSECDIVTLPRSGSQFSGIRRCSMSSYCVPAGAQVPAAPIWFSHQPCLRNVRESHFAEEETRQEAVGLGLNSSCLMLAHLLPPVSPSFQSLLLEPSPGPVPPGPQCASALPGATLHGDCQPLNPPETRSSLGHLMPSPGQCPAPGCMKESRSVREAQWSLVGGAL